MLAFYWRIFPTAAVKLGCKIIGIICILWLMTVQITNFLMCRPLHAFWHLEMQTLPGVKCLDVILFILGSSITNSCIDLFTLLIPVQEILKLHTTRRNKIGLMGVFLLGSL